MTSQTLPTFAEIAEQRLADAGPRDKVIVIKVAINTARMMVAAEKAGKRAEVRAVLTHGDEDFLLGHRA